MEFAKRIIGVVFAVMVVTAMSAPALTRTRASLQQAASQSAPTRPVGTIQSIVGNAITLKTDAGTEISVVTGDSTRILRIEPGQRDLSHATAIQLQDLQVGDRILVSGHPAETGNSLNATTVVVMKKSDVQAQQEQQREQWQRGVGGLVQSTDAATGNIVVNVAALGGTRTVTIHTSKETILRRYAPDSVKFDDAKPGTLEQVHPGDQLRARGTRSVDGATFDAQEIVSGSFRNIAGTISGVDVAANAVRVMDLISKKEVLVKFTAESEIRQLPSMMAQGIAMRLRRVQGAESANGGPAGANRPPDGQAEGSQAAARFQRTRGAGGPPADLQQMLNRLPAAKVADLQKGEAVMIVSTAGAEPGEVTAITMLGGVEAILEAAPKGQQAMTLSPWSLSAPSEGEPN